jgi:diadenosine tetraphosphate (Ap4A) HIT family hydrolase
MEGYFFETQHWKILLSEDQRYLGYLIIKTKVGRQTLPELTKEEQLDFFELIGNLETFFKEKIGATMCNYSCLMNFAYRDNQTPHVHFHFRPRYRNPITLAGHTFTDPNFGYHYLEPTLNDNGVISIPDEIRTHLMKEMHNYLSQIYS